MGCEAACESDAADVDDDGVEHPVKTAALAANNTHNKRRFIISRASKKPFWLYTGNQNASRQKGQAWKAGDALHRSLDEVSSPATMKSGRCPLQKATELTKF